MLYVLYNYVHVYIYIYLSVKSFYLFVNQCWTLYISFVFSFVMVISINDIIVYVLNIVYKKYVVYRLLMSTNNE